jgi:hypothetical protein
MLEVLEWLNQIVGVSEDEAGQACMFGIEIIEGASMTQDTEMVDEVMRACEKQWKERPGEISHGRQDLSTGDHPKPHPLR